MRADAAGRRVHDHRLAGLEVGVLAQQDPGGGALYQHGERRQVVHAVGHGEGHGLVGDRTLGVSAATGQERDDPPAVRRAPDHLAARDERQLGRRLVRVLHLVGVGVVQADPRDVDQHLTGPGRRLGYLDGLQHLGPAELGHLYSTHLCAFRLFRLCSSDRPYSQTSWARAKKAARLLPRTGRELHTGKRGPYRPVRLASATRADVRRRVPVRQLPRRTARALRPYASCLRGGRDGPAQVRDAARHHAARRHRPHAPARLARVPVRPRARPLHARAPGRLRPRVPALGAPFGARSRWTRPRASQPQGAAHPAHRARRGRGEPPARRRPGRGGRGRRGEPAGGPAVVGRRRAAVRRGHPRGRAGVRRRRPRGLPGPARAGARQGRQGAGGAVRHPGGTRGGGLADRRRPDR